MAFGKRVPKRKTSCCFSCTSHSESKDRVPRRQNKVRKVQESDYELFEDPPKPKVSMRRVGSSFNSCDQDALSVSPTKWLSNMSALDGINVVERLDHEVFQVFLSHISAKIPLNGMEIPDLLSLVGVNTISLSVLKKIENMLNKDNSNSFSFFFNDFLSDPEVVTELIQSRYPMSQLIMYLDVSVDEDGEICFSEHADDDNSHFTLAIFDFESLTLSYGDTLGWEIPSLFVDKLKELLSQLGCLPVFYTVLCHSPNDVNSHLCERECSPLYPLQTSDSISGLAVIICMTIASKQYDAYLSMVLGIPSKEEAYFQYLTDMSDYSKFLRLVVCSWIVNDAVNICNIMCCDELVNYSEYGLSSGLGKQSQNSLTKELQDTPSGSHLPLRKDADRNVSNMFESKLSSSYHLDEFIACRPLVHFCKPNHFRLKLNLKDGRNLYKMFRCTGRGDQASLQTIMEFLDSHRVVDWVKSKTFKNTAIMPSTRLRKNRTCNILDFPDDLQSYFIKNPELSFERKIRYLVLRIYVRGCPSVMTKKFQCTTAGKSDGHAIRRINSYINSKEFRDLVVNNARSEFKLSDDKLNHANFEDLILRKPMIHHIKDRSILKLECQLRSGKRIYRGFACSSAGKGDLKTMATIKKFLTSKEAADWVRSKYEVKVEKKKTEKHKNTPKPIRDDVWLPAGELAVGYEVKHFFDSVDFDFRKRIVMAKGVQSLYEGNAIITENEKWGKTHRFDETYVVNESLVTEKGVFPAVTMYISCSSKSSQCKAQCGTPLKDLANTAIGTECPGCKGILEFPSKECANCTTNSTPKWYSLNGELMCSACYQYQQKHNDSRPSELKVKSAQGVSRLYHPHFVCGWRLKLIIYSNDLTIWKLFKHKDNKTFHSAKIEEVDKKPDVPVISTSTVLVTQSSPKCQKVIIRNKDTKPILCSRCISDQTSAPFICTSQTELIKHISIAHKIDFMNCATCWSDTGSIVTFENEHQLQQHIDDNHRGEQRYSADDCVDPNRHVELDEAVIALLEPSPI